MSQSGAKVSPQVQEVYQDLKGKRKYKFVIFKMSDKYDEIEVEHADADAEWESFRSKLLDAKSKSKSGVVGAGPRYAVYDFEFTHDGRQISKVLFFAWSPDNAGIQPKMVYASSKEALKQCLPGFAYEIQANDADDIEYDSVHSFVVNKIKA